jgi:signal transduction histidine kinase
MSEKKKTRILLVDDNSDDAYLIRESLHKSDPSLSIKIVDNGLECLKRLSEEEYHLMLLDYKIPLRDGLSVLDEIRNKGHTLPIIMVTGFGNETIAVESMKRGAYDYVVKSHTYLDGLPIIISRALESHEFKKENERLERQLIQSEKLAGIGTLAAGVTHEINNPLQGIFSLAELILEAAPPPAIAEYAQKIVDLSERIAHIVRRLSQFSRVISQMGLADTQLNRVIDESIELATLSPGFMNIEILKEYQASACFEAHPTEVSQVFINLLNNAKDAMNGVGQLTIRTRDLDEFTEAEVSDTGPGIPDDILKQIFDPFFTTKGPGKGTGLGLSISQRIVERYKGEIHIETKAGKGTTFKVRFPMKTSMQEF